MGVCCIAKSRLPQGLTKGVHIERIPLDVLCSIEQCFWLERSDAEQDVRFMQIIPYTVMIDAQHEIVSYQRHGKEKRLSGLWSCGIGGHIEDGDKGESFKETVLEGFCREMKEEFRDFTPDSQKFSYQGVITEDHSRVGLMHLGCVFLYRVSPDEEPLVPGEELLHMKKETVECFLRKPHEYWSELALTAIKEGGE
jgi:predicted NUDIX family phosphoesterase